MTRAAVISGIDERRPLYSAGASLAVGVVIAYDIGANTAQVRLTGSNRVIQQVLIPADTLLRAQDRILLTHVPGESRWLAIIRVQASDEYGLTTGETTEADELHPPSNLVVSGFSGIVVATWQAWAGGTVCFEVESNTSESSSGSSSLYTRGSVFVRECASSSIFVRVRSLRYDPSEGVAFYSAWTPWSSASSRSPSLDVGLLETWMEHQEHVLEQHILGNLL